MKHPKFLSLFLWLAGTVCGASKSSAAMPVAPLYCATTTSVASSSAAVTASNNNRWTYYLSYHNATQTLAAGNAVYAILNGHLLVYDAETQTSVLVDRMSAQLSGSTIRYMGWSETCKCLVVVYDDNNVDLLYPKNGDGTTGDFDVVNLPQLKNYTEDNITIRKVNVYNDWACVTTTKGVILISLVEENVHAYYQIGSDIADAIVEGKYVYLAKPDCIVSGLLSDNLYDAQQWKTAIPTAIVDAFVGSKAGVYAVFPYKSNFPPSRPSGVMRLTLNADGTGSYKLVSPVVVTGGNANGKQVQFFTRNYLVAVNTDNPDVEAQRIATTLQPQSITRTANGAFFLAQGDEGLLMYTPSATDTTLPDAVEKVGNFGPRHAESYGLLVNNGKLYLTGGSLESFPTTGFLGCYEGGKWTDMDEDAARNDPPRDGRVRNFFNTIMHVAVDPRDPNHVMAASYGEGIYEYQNGKFKKLYNSDNSWLISANPTLIDRNSYVNIGGVAYDAQGNLWASNNHADSAFVVFKTDGTWQRVSLGEGDKIRRMERVFIDSKGRVWVNGRYSTRTSTGGVAALDYNGTLSTTSDDRTRYRNSCYNEDGAECALSSTRVITEDNEGQIWIGSETGIYAVTNPDDWFSSSFRIYQPKVPRNDGTNYADYLLKGNTVNAIAVDGGNRKWIGTLGAGVYLVNADGSEILAHYTSSDSPLLSDNINDLAIDEDNGRLYISTDCGLCSVETGVTPANPSLSKNNIKVYPNPVRPDYSGSVTVTGLTEGAEVKVLSTGSQLVARGTAIGGSWQWDVTQQSSGNRVAPGVYYIMISTSDGKNSVGAKLVVI